MLNMIRTIIIDDEESCINRLEGLLEKNAEPLIHNDKSCRTFEDGLDAIAKLKPDLIFLDVQIHNKTGFDLLRQIGQINFEIIFTTAYEQYAIQAFKFSAMDYLLKPIDKDELLQAIQKVHRKLMKESSAEKLDVLFHNLKGLSGQSKKIVVPTMSGATVLSVNEIIRCEANINYTTIFLKDKQKIIVAKTLKDFEELLRDYSFFRVHQSHLINLHCVKSYQKGKGGSVLMTDSSTIEVSFRKKADFLARLAEI